MFCRKLPHGNHPRSYQLETVAAQGGFDPPEILVIDTDEDVLKGARKDGYLTLLVKDGNGFDFNTLEA